MILILAVALPGLGQAESDPFQWLEEVESKKALSWVKSHNEATLNILQKDPNYPVFLKASKDILNAKDRIPYGSLRGQYIYNFGKTRSISKVFGAEQPKSYQEDHQVGDHPRL